LILYIILFHVFFHTNYTGSRPGQSGAQNTPVYQKNGRIHDDTDSFLANSSDQSLYRTFRFLQPGHGNKDLRGKPWLINPHKPFLLKHFTKICFITPGPEIVDAQHPATVNHTTQGVHHIILDTVFLILLN